MAFPVVNYLCCLSLYILRAQESGKFVQISKPDAKRYEGVYGYMESEPLSDLHHLNGTVVLESTEKELQTFLQVLKIARSA